MRIYCMSDIHGCYDEFMYALSYIDLSRKDTMLILLGDYIHGGGEDLSVLEKIMQLQNEYGADRVVALLGNHEDMYLRGEYPISRSGNYEESKEDKCIDWLYGLPRYYEGFGRIFCHAGVCEEAGEYWEWSTDDYTYTEKYPAQTGKFYMDIIAGHIGTSTISGDPCFNDVYFDGYSHYYIDGSVLKSGQIPILMINTEKNNYYSITENGMYPILSYTDTE